MLNVTTALCSVEPTATTKWYEKPAIRQQQMRICYRRLCTTQSYHWLEDTDYVQSVSHTTLETIVFSAQLYMWICTTFVTAISWHQSNTLTEAVMLHYPASKGLSQLSFLHLNHYLCQYSMNNVVNLCLYLSTFTSRFACRFHAISHYMNRGYSRLRVYR